MFIIFAFAGGLYRGVYQLQKFTRELLELLQTLKNKEKWNNKLLLSFTIFFFILMSNLLSFTWLRRTLFWQLFIFQLETWEEIYSIIESLYYFLQLHYILHTNQIANPGILTAKWCCCNNTSFAGKCNNRKQNSSNFPT